MERTDMHRLQEVVRLHRQGLSAREVARRLVMSPNTERRYREALQLACLLEGDPAAPLPELEVLRDAVLAQMPVRTLPQQVSSIETWQGKVFDMANNGAKPKAIFDRLVLEETDFHGTLWAVKRLYNRWRKEQGVRPQDVAINVHTDPAQIAQVDFGEVGRLLHPDTGLPHRAWVFIMVLGYSRHTFAKIVFDQRVETFIALHSEAFAYFGGVPHTIVPDNLKAAVIRAAFGVDRQDESLNRTYLELARYYDFLIDPTPPYAPKKKGKVESAVRYVKRNFFAPRSLTDIALANQQLEQWCLHTAGTRTHGTTHQQPLVVFLEEEQSKLHALPAQPYVPITWKRATVHQNSHLAFDKREYSAPFTLIGQRLWLRATPHSVCIYNNDERVATHPRHGDSLQSTIDSHLPEHRRELRHRSKEYWVARAAAMGSAVQRLVQCVFDEEGRMSRLRVVQGIVTLLEKYPETRATSACERAVLYGNHTYQGLRDILQQGLDQQTLSEPSVPSNPERPRFSRVPRLPAS